MVGFLSRFILFALCLIQGCIILYFGSDVLINRWIGRGDDVVQDAAKEAVNVIVLNKCEFIGNIVTYGKVRAKHNVALKIPGFGNHKVLVDKIHFKAGDYVTKDQALVDFRCEELEHKLLALQKDCEHSEKYFDRINKTPNSISDYEREDAKIKLEKAKAEYSALESFINSINIKAPFNGVVGLPNVVEGEQAIQDKFVTNIVGQSDLTVEFHVDPAQINNLCAGSTVIVSNFDDKERDSACVVGVNPYIDDNDNKIKVIAKISNRKNDIFRHNLPVKIIIDKNPINMVYVVPRNTIIENGTKQMVYKVEKTYNGHCARLVEIKVIDTKGDLCAVESQSLNDGDYIISEGMVRRDGAHVYIKEILDCY